PGGSGVFPNTMQRALDGRLREPRFSFFRADVEENPVWSAERDVNTFGWRSATWITERRAGHLDLLSGKGCIEKKRFQGIWRRPISVAALADGRMGQSGS